VTAQSVCAASRLLQQVQWAFSEELNWVGFGFCIRDVAGDFLKAKMLCLTPMCRPEVGEVLGLFHAMQWIYELQLTNV